MLRERAKDAWHLSFVMLVLHLGTRRLQAQENRQSSQIRWVLCQQNNVMAVLSLASGTEIALRTRHYTKHVPAKDKGDTTRDYT